MSKLIKQKMYQGVILPFVLGVIVVAVGCVHRQQADRKVKVTQPMLDKLYYDAEALKSARKTTEAIARYKIFLAQHPTGLMCHGSIHGWGGLMSGMGKSNRGSPCLKKCLRGLSIAIIIDTQ